MRMVFYFLVILGLQGSLPLILPRGIVPPDLFLLSALVIAARQAPVLGMLAGFGLGLLQDLLGAGNLGIHATAIAAGVYAYYLGKVLFNQHFPTRELVCTLMAIGGYWLGLLLINYWLSSNLITLQTLYTVTLSHIVLTLLVAPSLLLFARWAFGAVPEEESGI